MYIEFRLPQGAGGQSPGYALSIIQTRSRKMG
jgi:hypothetical protein